MSIKISSSLYSNLPLEQKEAIGKIISTTFKGEIVEEVPVAPESACTTACEIGYDVAVTACQALPWPANIACVRIAKKALDECLHLCD
jgi:hypothetical protein